MLFLAPYPINNVSGASAAFNTSAVLSIQACEHLPAKQNVLGEEGDVLVMNSTENTLSCKWVPIRLTRAALSDYKLISSSFHAW